jgi:hypothetical protein
MNTDEFGLIGLIILLVVFVAVVILSNRRMTNRFK